MSLTRRDIDHVFERLRSGVVPERGIDAFAVGIERQRAEIGRLLDMAAGNEGVFKFLRGGYGCGKTFMARLAILDAQAKGFATSFVVVSDNDLHFHKFDDVYRKIMQELSTNSCPRGALPDIIDRWIAKVEDAVIAGGINEDDPDLDERVAARLGEELASKTAGKVPEDMVRVLRTVFKLKQDGNLGDAGALLSWLGGSANVAATTKRLADVKGDIESRDAMDYLHGILEVVKMAGYRGLVIVIDEIETILRMRQDVRGKSLNGIRQIIDAAAGFPGLLWVLTGTPEFFDTKRGVAGLAPLHDRISFQNFNGVASLRQAQLELKPFDRVRLRDVALRLREMYPTADRASLERKVTVSVVERLVAKVTEGFRGDVGVVPRQFLRQLVSVLDLVSEEGVAPEDIGLDTSAMTEDEHRLLAGTYPCDPEPGDDAGYSPTDVTF
jgi:hypothetical protein